ncbi:MAG: hypothetical protein K2X87_08020 [Gemmataceae bacterium]|nr:hypothetical protein [Gemmataceae bacterium]
MLPFIFVLCLAGATCLAPLGLYLLWLAALNRRDRPTVVPGGWDFTALACGLGGFLLFGGGLLLALVRSNVRFGVRGNFEALRDAWAQERLSWGLFALAYLVVVLGGVVAAGLTRRRSLVFYNAEPDLVEAALVDLFDQLGRPVERRGNLWVAGTPLFELEPFAAARTVTLRWLSDDRRLLEEVARHLRDTVPPDPHRDNPAAPWLMTGAVLCGVAVSFCSVLLGYGLALIR